ncbi:MAG: PIN domain-containing protein [Rhodospirillales bacterium]|nr:PIN domain-containing protein [Rhodospirillales bacterium]
MPGAKFFLDSNVVLYAIGNDAGKRDIAAGLLSRHPVISTQVLLETANVCKRKFGLDVSAIKNVLGIVESTADVRLITSDSIRHALEFAERYGFTVFDSLIAATAIEAGCTTLYSEDFQHGQKIAGSLTIIDPFR